MGEAMSLAETLVHAEVLGLLSVAQAPLLFGNFTPGFAGPVIKKTGAGTVSVSAGTFVAVGARVLRYVVDTPVVMPALTQGEDYSVWVAPSGVIQAVADPFSAPAAAPVVGARKIGGFHYSLTLAGTTVAGGSFATTGSGMIWTQADVDLIAGINAWSIWDLGFRPRCDPRGMALVSSSFWMDLYLCGTNHPGVGTSRAGSDVASGSVLAKRPAMFGGNGVATYADLTWWSASEIAVSAGKSLPTYAEFCAAAFGVTEAQSLGGASVTIPATLRQPGYTSKFGLEQASGHQLVWCADASTRPDGTAGWAWRNNTGGRGQLYLYSDTGNVRCTAGGARYDGAFSGSRCSYWHNYPWGSYWFISLRARGDHLILR